jgi:hypothetical protein
MSHTSQAPSIIIKREHQSAPKAHWADTEINKAATEISEGRWIDDPTNPEAVMDSLGIALGVGTEGVGKGERPTLDDFRTTRDLNQLGRHPRVIEAIEKMRLEVDTTSNPQEQVEKAWALHEMVTLQSQDQKWEGQERWEGKENEEMRHGRLLTPQDFYKELCEIIGDERVYLSPHAVKENPGDRSGRVGLYIHNPMYRGGSMLGDLPQQQVKKLRDEGQAKMLEARQFRQRGLHTLANKAFDQAAEMAKVATEILMEISATEQLEPPMLRVGSLQWPLGTEWMVMHFNQYGVPTTAKYMGWRTALLTMVRAQCITEDEAARAFPVGSGPAGDWYLQQLYMRRNRGTAVS